MLLFGDEGYQVGRIQFIRCNRFVLEFISWLILFYGVWCWIVTHGSKTQIEAKIKPRSQLWEKNATVRRSWCQKLGPSAPNISSAHRKWFCWCHILHFSTSRHFFVSKICRPLFWQQWYCFWLDVLQPQEYTWAKGQHLLLMINVADWYCKSSF